MLRTTIGLSFILVVGGLAACSSKATDNDTNLGGNGTIVGGGASSGGASGGTTAPGAGTTGTPGGMTSTAAGTGGTTGTAGSNSGACPAGTVTCTDATHVQVCDTTTGALETFSCIDEYATLGFNSTGCSADATGEGCDLTGVKDEACNKGTSAYAFCAGVTANDELVNIYVNCFQDYMGAHTIVPCFSNYVSETMTTDADCQNAVDACLGAGGAGPIDMGGGGAGGAP